MATWDELTPEEKQRYIDAVYASDVMLPPSADAAFTPTVPTAGSSYQFGDVGRDAGNEALQAAYTQLAGAVNPQSRNLLDVATNYATGTAGGLLSGAIGLGQKAGGYAADVLGAGAEALGSDRWSRGGAAQALYGDMGAGSQAAGLGTEANALGLLSDLGAGKYARGAITDRLNQTGPVPTMYSNPIAGLISDVKASDSVAVRGAEIMDMLKSGRGSEVTEQMLDMGDPVLNARLNEYLYRNYDLPMDEASRMQRAGDIQAYHGTTANFPAFDGRSYAASGFGTHMGGKEAADSILKVKRSPYAPKDTPTYVDGSQVLPLRVDAGPMLRVDDTETWTPNATQFAMAWSDDPAAVEAYNKLQANPNYPKFGTEAEQSAFMQNELEKSGFGGFVYNNKFEGGGDSYAVLNPANIRSRFARFDPRLSHLKNLSASIGAGLLGANMMPDRGNQQ